MFPWIGELCLQGRRSFFPCAEAPFETPCFTRSERSRRARLLRGSRARHSVLVLKDDARWMRKGTWFVQPPFPLRSWSLAAGVRGAAAGAAGRGAVVKGESLRAESLHWIHTTRSPGRNQHGHEGGKEEYHRDHGERPGIP